MSEEHSFAVQRFQEEIRSAHRFTVHNEPSVVSRSIPHLFPGIDELPEAQIFATEMDGLTLQFLLKRGV